jgi:mono/diheme cytochrome c family protein
MPYKFQSDTELEKSTNRVMVWGVVLMVALAAAFPLYRWVEPTDRTEARAQQLESLAEQGGDLWSISCSSCHGLAGEGLTAPALNSTQFLQSATDTQTELIISVGIPGSQMSAYSQDFAGPLTSEQIRAIALFIRSWEDTAPDRPDWRDPNN